LVQIVIPFAALRQQQCAFALTRIDGLENGLNRRGYGWLSLEVSGLRKCKILNPDNRLRHSLDVDRCPQKVEERVKGYSVSRYKLDSTGVFGTPLGFVYCIMY